MTTTYNTRPEINTGYQVRQGLRSDLGYLITQLGILNTNSGERIVFNTGIFTDQPTRYNTRPIIN